MPRTKGRKHHRRNRTRKGGFLGLFENKPQQPSYASPATSTSSSSMFGTPSGASTTNWWDSLNIFGKPKQATPAPLTTSYSSPTTNYSSSMVKGGRRRRSRRHRRH